MKQCKGANMFDIKNMDFIGNDAFVELLNTFFSGVPMERVFDGDVPGVRVYVPCKKTRDTTKNQVDEKDGRDPSWMKEVQEKVPTLEVIQPKVSEIPLTKRTEPKSILEMLEDGDEQLEKLLGKIIDKKLADRNISIPEVEVPVEKKNPFVYIANRLTFLIQTRFPLVFDTSIIKADVKSMTIAVNEGKTVPKLNHIDELGFITSEVNRDEEIQKELEEYLDDTEYGNIFCFPSVTRDEGEDGEAVYAVKFVLYPKK